MTIQDDLDLSRFVPDPNTKEIAYKAVIDDGCVVVYARKVDNIIPFDRLEISIKKQNVIYPKSVYKKEMYHCLSKKTTSFRLLCCFITILLSQPYVDRLLVSLLFSAACNVASNMPVEKADYYTWNASQFETWPVFYQKRIYDVLYHRTSAK